MSENKSFFNRLHIFFQILILLGITGGTVGVFTIMGVFLIKPLYGITNIFEFIGTIQTDLEAVKKDYNAINAFRFIQLISTTIGLFLAPAIIFGLLKKPGGDYLKLRRPFNPLFLIFSLLILLFAGPMVNILQEWNAGLKLPHFLKGLEDSMKSSEALAAKETEVFMVMPRLKDFLFNFFIIGIMTAIAEEAFFRGVLQQLFREAFKNVHVAIWIGAAVFSALHFEFYGFLPRMFLGALLGYLFYWSGNLWVPIVGHLANNGGQVLLVYLHQQGKISYDINSDEPIPMHISITLTALLAGFLYLSYKYRKLEPIETYEPAAPEPINPTLDSDQWR